MGDPDARNPETGLLTEPAFRAALDRRLDAKARSEDATGLAVLSIHIERFGEAGDQAGGGASCWIMQAAAERLTGCVRNHDQIAHGSGGLFRILLEPLHAAELAASITDKVARVLGLPFVVAQHHIAVSPTIGISLYPGDDATAAGLIDNADASLYRARRLGSCYQFHDPGTTAAWGHGPALEHDPREALECGQFALHFQPRVAVSTGTVVSAEALLRWHHPIHGPISPATFIPIAESTDLIHEIGQWVLQRACEQAAAWRSSGGRPVGVSVNVSGRQLDHPGFPEVVEHALSDAGLPGERLELEITESAMIRRPEEVTATLRRLRGLGVRIALDDFGTGYSSLAYLRSLPLDTLKIDRSFINDLAAEDGNVVLLRSIVDLAHALGLDVIAEGVETCAQRDKVAQQRCDEIQGFWIAPALPADRLEQDFLVNPAHEDPGRDGGGAAI